MEPAIIVHGGAGPVDDERMPRCRQGCARAAGAGWAVLAAGGSALDAVQAAVEVLEDDPEFNAGRGAVLNHEGVIEVDAALMAYSDGEPRAILRGGGVGAVPWLRHPIRVARAVLDENRHLLLVGAGALALARAHGIEPESREALVTERSQRRWLAERAGTLGPSGTGDTVGATAIDAAGGIASATSTGGISSKQAGRVGDSPIPGAGLYAAAAGAVSATGHGESILRVCLSHHVVARMAAGDDAQAAASAGAAYLEASTGGQGGVITVDARGRVGQARNTRHMPWASVVGGVGQGGA